MNILLQKFLVIVVLIAVSRTVYSCNDNQNNSSKDNKEIVATSKISIQESNLDDTIKKEYSKNGRKLPFTLLHYADSSNTDKEVLIVFLHGAGERGIDNKAQLSVALPNLVKSLKQQGLKNFTVFAPQCPTTDRWVDVDWSTTSHLMKKEPHWPMRYSFDIIDSIVKNNPNLDTNRMYVTGLSMGGYGTWEMIQRRPDFFAAAIPICGGGDKTLGKKLINIPIWMFHGTKDKAVPVIRTSDMYNAIKRDLAALPLKAKMTLYENKGHLIWNETYDNQEVIKWLLSQRKNP